MRPSNVIAPSKVIVPSKVIAPSNVIARRRSRRRNLMLLPLLLTIAACDKQESTVFDTVTYNIDPSRITTEGRGSAEPIASNDTAAGRAKNRRAEVVVKAQ